MARDFNGSTDRLDWSSLGNLTGSALTISAWVYIDTYPGGATSTEYIFCTHQSGDAAFALAFVMYGVNGAMEFFRNGTTLIIRTTSATLVPTGAWTHVLVTHDGTMADYTKVKIYIGGTEATYTGTNQNGASEVTGTGSWSLGGRIYDDARNIDGKLAEVSVWNRVLTTGEISALAGGSAPSLIPTNLLYYYSAKTDTTTAETGGAAATADGTSYSAGHPTINYGSPYYAYAQQ